MREQVLFENAAGKTVERVELQCDDLWLMYTDGTFSHLHCSSYCGDTYMEQPRLSMDNLWAEADLNSLHEFGILDDAEVGRRREDIERRDAELKSQSNERNRREYERLKKMFESKDEVENA